MKYSLRFRQRYDLLFLLCFFVLSNCSGKREKSELTIGALNGPSGLSLLKLMNENEISKDEEKEEYIVRNDPELIKAMMLREEIDIALLPFTMAALLYNNDLHYELLGVSVWGSMYLLGKDTSIHSIEQLQNVTVHVLPRNTTPDIIFRHLLVENNLDPTDELVLDYTFPTPLELSSALQANRVDFGLVPEPMASRVLKSNSDMRRLLDLTELWENLYGDQIPLAQTAVMVHTSYAMEHKKELGNWCEKYADAIVWGNAHPWEAAELAVHYGLARDKAVVADALPRCRMDFRYAIEYKKQLNDYLRLLYKMNKKVIGNSIPDDAFYYEK